MRSNDSKCNEKTAQYESYDRNGAIAGAVAGGALSAVLSSLYYGKKDKKKQSFAKRFLKGLLWTLAGSAGGGLAGAGIGRALRTHATYSKNLEDAKMKLRAAGVKPRKGRLLLVNYPDNKYKGDEYKLVKKIFPDGAPVQHAVAVTMDEDGSNAKVFGAGLISGKLNEDWGRMLVGKGLKEQNNDMVISGARMLSGKINRGGLFVYGIGDILKGKGNDEIAKILADYGKKHDLGDKVEVFEGKRGIDVELPEMFARVANRRVNGPNGRGYEFLPGGYNCGTLGRDMYNTVNGDWSHWKDMLIGGWPDQNMPSSARKFTASSHNLENRENMFNVDRHLIDNIY